MKKYITKKKPKTKKPVEKSKEIVPKYQGELFKITPDKLVIPVNDHLDIKISRLTTEITYATIFLNSFAFDLIRAWYIIDGKEEEHKIKKEYNGHPDYESFSNKLSLYGMFHQFEKYEDVYLRVKLTENPDPFKRKWFYEENPEGFLKIDYTREYQSRYEYSDIQFPLILISENEKVLEMKEKFLEFRKHQNRRARLEKLSTTEEEGEFHDIVQHYCPVMNEVADSEEKWDADKALEDVHEGILQSHWQKLDEMSDDEIKKLKEERKNEWFDLVKKRAAVRLAEEKIEAEEKKKRREAEQQIPKKKKKCVIM